MALSCPIGLDIERLHRDVRAEYTRVAEDPHGDFHFHRGFDYAVDVLGYSAAELRSLPPHSVERFAGIGNPLALGRLARGQAVLDIGSGAGVDLLLAARAVGPTGRAIGIDPTAAMRAQAAAAAVEAGVAPWTEILAGTADAIPLPDASVDVIISNGVLNLSYDKVAAFTEILRVLRPGGQLWLADVVLARELSEGARSDIDLWAA